MTAQQIWKNFNLGEELSISGAMIYNGLRHFHEMQVIDHTDEIFEFFYDLSVGLERLLKIAVVLIEHEENSNQEALEKSIITHNHLDLIARVRKHYPLRLGQSHNEFLALLGTFYKSLRYDRFTLSSVYHPEQEKALLSAFLSKHLNVQVAQSDDSLLATPNHARYRKFIRRLVTKIAGQIYDVVKNKAFELNIDTHDVRHGSKAEAVFQGQADLVAEEVLCKELIIFFMNTKSSSGCLEFLRGIAPLEFDPELATEYLQCFQSNSARALLVDELHQLYEEVDNVGQRLEWMDLVGNPNAYFDSPELGEGLR